jgi:hypothetical protein
VALFIGIGVGYAGGPYGGWALALSLAASAAALAGMGFGLATDARRDSHDYSGWGPFEFEDGIYLIGPITWIGGLAGFFVLGALGQIVFSAFRLRELSHARPPASAPSLESPGAREHT